MIMWAGGGGGGGGGLIIRKTSRCLRAASTNRAHLEWWEQVGLAPKDPITSVTEAFLADSNPTKLNLGVGACLDEEGKPLVLQCVRDAQASISGGHFLESVSSAAGSKLVEESVKLVYGKNSCVVKEGRVAGVQTLSGTAACRLFAEFQRRFYPESTIYLPNPTWSNHHNIWRDAKISRRCYSYYDSHSLGLNFAALVNDVKNAPEGSFFLLHPCAHNPTGVDPSEEQWREISYQFKVKSHFPFFDVAYQGITSGDLDKDAQSIHIFLEDGHLIGCAQSFAKNMALYGHRVGCLSLLCKDTKQAVAIKSQLQQITRALYSSPPIHGALLVSTILSDPEIRALWSKELKDLVNRIRKMRHGLRERLEQLGSSLNWDHITNQVGMFCFTGLSAAQVDLLARDFHVYMTHDGRMSMAGVTTRNMDHLANAIHQVTKFNQKA